MIYKSYIKSKAIISYMSFETFNLLNKSSKKFFFIIFIFLSNKGTKLCVFMQQSAIFLAISLIVSNFVVYNRKYDTMLNLRKILCTVFVTATGVAMATEPIQYSAEALASYGDGDLGNINISLQYGDTI